MNDSLRCEKKNQFSEDKNVPEESETHQSIEFLLNQFSILFQNLIFSFLCRALLLTVEV